MCTNRISNPSQSCSWLNSFTHKFRHSSKESLRYTSSNPLHSIKLFLCVCHLMFWHVALTRIEMELLLVQNFVCFGLHAITDDRVNSHWWIIAGDQRSSLQHSASDVEFTIFVLSNPSVGDMLIGAIQNYFGFVLADLNCSTAALKKSTKCLPGLIRWLKCFLNPKPSC